MCVKTCAGCSRPYLQERVAAISALHDDAPVQSKPGPWKSCRSFMGDHGDNHQSRRCGPLCFVGRVRSLLFLQSFCNCCLVLPCIAQQVLLQSSMPLAILQKLSVASWPYFRWLVGYIPAMAIFIVIFIITIVLGRKISTPAQGASGSGAGPSSGTFSCGVVNSKLPACGQACARHNVCGVLRAVHVLLQVPGARCSRQNQRKISVLRSRIAAASCLGLSNQLFLHSFPTSRAFYFQCQVCSRRASLCCECVQAPTLSKVRHYRRRFRCV